ncbi:MAG: dTDP-4-dehydrorhamnose 3,5-epimerase family protein [Rhodoglobus sp.]
MQIRELSVPDSYEITPQQFADDRGVFLEWYRFDKLEAVIGHRLELRQANTSVSQAGVVRGIHYADVPPGQGKYVTVTHGAGIDFVVDIRVGSPTFGQWDSVILDTIDRRAVYVAEGLGHAFIALTDDATLTYLVSDVYKPGAEHDINVLDPEIGLVFPPELGELVLSPKDKAAPTLAQRLADGTLPSYAAATEHYAANRKERN